MPSLACVRAPPSGVAYCVAAPLITPFVLAYMGTAYLLWRYQMLYVCVRAYEGGARTGTHVSMRAACVGCCRRCDPATCLAAPIALHLGSTQPCWLSAAVSAQTGGTMWPVYFLCLNWCVGLFVVFTSSMFIFKQANIQVGGGSEMAQRRWC